jgi:hypothetical protein
MLFTVFGEPVMTGDVELGVPALRRAFRLFASTVFPVETIDERRASGVSMLAFGVFLRTLLLALLCHHDSLRSMFGTARGRSG